MLSHVQEKVLALGRLNGDDSWSAGSSYTGITTTPNLRSFVNYFFLHLGCGHALCMMEDRAALVQEQVDAELDATLDYPSQGAIVVVCGVIHQEWVVETVNIYWELRWHAVDGFECPPDIF